MTRARFEPLRVHGSPQLRPSSCRIGRKNVPARPAASALSQCCPPRAVRPRCASRLLRPAAPLENLPPEVLTRAFVYLVSSDDAPTRGQLLPLLCLSRALHPVVETVADMCVRG